MDLLVVTIRGKSGQIRTHLHTKIHTHKKTKSGNQKNKKTKQGVKEKRKERGEERAKRKEEKGRKDKRKRRGDGVRGVEERGY